MALSTFTSQANLNHLWAALLVEEFVRQGVTFFCVSPGSRSTPLTTAVARHPEAETLVHVDERGAAFTALGYARGAKMPAAWITTSGTAVANGLPAVVEASADYVPMLMLTADRPPELRDTGANQTIDQVKIFGSYVRWQADVAAPTLDISPEALLTTAAQAVHRARRSPAGPVHLNCMFRKPLAPVPDGVDYGAYLNPLRHWANGNEPFTRYRAGSRAVALVGEHESAPDWLERERGVIVAGTLTEEADRRATAKLASALGWPLLPDVRSGLRLSSCFEGSTSIPYVDQILASTSFRQSHPPETVLHIGGRVVSKRLRAFIKESSPETYALVCDTPDRLDPDHGVTHRFECAPALWIGVLDVPDRGHTAWLESWRRANDAAADVIERWADDAGRLSEPLVARRLTRLIPDDQALCVASSMPIRDVNRYGWMRGSALEVAANRGASGIDGTISTAVGFSRGLTKPVTLCVGDLALLHDLNALALLREVPVTVVAVNNDGGGIFHFLPIAEHPDVFEPYFGTPHGLSFEHAAAMFDLDYIQPKSPAEFEKAYLKCVHSGRSSVIEIMTDREENAALHEKLETLVSDSVAEVMEQDH